MSLNEIKSAIPDYAKDLRLNFEAVLSEAGAPGLSSKQIGLIALASAITSRHEPLVAVLAGEAAKHASAQELDGARTAAALMAMNNIYYRFTHLASSPDYRQMPAKLRMNVIGKPGVEKADFELWSLAVSAINGCGMCIDAHDKILREAGVTAEQIQAAVRIAALVHAVAATMDGVTATETAQQRAA